jgi:hypothetical protein
MRRVEEGYVKGGGRPESKTWKQNGEVEEAVRNIK